MKFNFNYTGYKKEDFENIDQYNEYNKLCRNQEYNDDVYDKRTIPMGQIDNITPDYKPDSVMLYKKSEIIDDNITPDYRQDMINLHLDSIRLHYQYTDNQLLRQTDLNSGFNMTDIDTVYDKIDDYGLSNDLKLLVTLLVDGYSVNEISDKMDTPVSTVYSRLDSIRKAMIESNI